jgi:hypothetical protein
MSPAGPSLPRGATARRPFLMVKRALRQDARTAPAAPFCHGYDPVTGNLAPEAVKRCGNAPWCWERKAWIVERADVPRMIQR